MPSSAKIGQMSGARWRCEEDIGGLDISVNDVVGVEVCERGEEILEMGDSVFRS